MSSFHPSFLKRFKVSAPELKALQLLSASKARLRAVPGLTEAGLESLRQAALVESVESSNRLEGIVTAPGRVRGLVARKLKPENRDEAQIAGYRDALSLIHDPRRRPGTDEAALLDLHRRLSAGEPGAGAYKARDNAIVERDPDGGLRLRFKPVSAKGTPAAMAQWFLQHHAIGSEGLDPVLGMGLLVLDLTCIHPFRDGNGRLSRLWTLLLAYGEGFEAARYISLERLTEQSKERCYHNLAASSRGWHEHKHDPHPWLSYFLQILLSAHLELEGRLQGLHGKRGDKSALVRSHILALTGDFSLAQVEQANEPIGKDLVRVVLRQLRQEEKVQMIGRGRGARYRVAKKEDNG
jgi:Fic family protein